MADHAEHADPDDAALLDEAAGGPLEGGEEPDVVPDDAPPPTAAAPPEERKAPPPEEDDYVADDALGPAGAGGVVLRYDGADWLEGLPSRQDIVAEQGGKVTAGLRKHLDAGKAVFFMPSDVEELNEYAGGQPTYILRLFGALMDGSKAEVVVTDVDVFFDVEVPDGAPGGARGFESHLRQLFADDGVAGARLERVEAFPGRGYRTEPGTFLRVRTPNLQQRKKAIAAAREAGFATASDDRSCYFRKVARETGTALSDWCVLSDYEHIPGAPGTSPLCAHSFRVPLGGLKPLVCAAAPRGATAAEQTKAKEAREAAERTKAQTPLLAKDRTLVLAWDIETHSRRRAGDVPRGTETMDNAFMIALTAHWKDDPAPLREVVIVDVETAPDPRWTTVVCGSAANVLKAFALCWRELAPDINVGFNDSGYDWPFVVEKAKSLHLLGWMFDKMSAVPPRRGGTSDEMVYKWNYQKGRDGKGQKIKISAEMSVLSTYLKVPGCVPIDARVCYQKLYAKAEVPKGSSLKFYLGLVGLPGKADMPIVRMWRTYEAALATEGTPDAASAELMRHVAYYCRVDALRCQQLLVRRNIVNDYREVSSLAYVSLADSHYYAGGMKVCNLVGAYAWRRNILISMIPREREEKGKYPGAYVFPPEKGLVPDPGRLAALDAAVLALREAIGPEATAALLRGEDARRLATAAAEKPGQPPEARLGHQRMAAAIEADQARVLSGAPPQWESEAAQFEKYVSNVRSWAKVAPDQASRLWQSALRAFAAFAGDRPVTGLDFSSLYPSLIMTYNLSPEKILQTKAEADHWRDQGRTLHDIQFQYNGRPITAWAVRHNNDPKELGLFPEVLIDLFNKRAEVKTRLAEFGAVKELIEVVDGRARKDKVALAEAIRRVLAEAQAETARLDAVFEAFRVSGPPAIRLSPGATLDTEMADLKRLRRNAQEQAEGLRLFLGQGSGRHPSDTDVEAAVRARYDDVSFRWVCANSKQNGIKVYMNSFYGETGNSLSPLFLLPLAGGVTSSGQDNIKKVAEFVEGQQFRKKYGDSVTGDTALVVRLAGVVRTVRVDELVETGDWKPYGEKESAVIPSLEVWSDTGFTGVNRIIRHDHEGQLWRVLTHTGIVDCTEDHSLLLPDGSPIRPTGVSIGDALLHANDRHLIRALDAVDGSGISPEEAWVMGLFAAEGTAAVYDRKCGSKLYRWVIVNQDKQLLDRAAERTPFPSKVFGPYANRMCQLLPVRHHKAPALRYRSLFYNRAGEKRVPPEILGAEFDVAHAFWMGFYEGDGYKSDPNRVKGLAIGQRGKEMVTGLWLLARRLGWDVSLNTREAHPNIFTIAMVDGPHKQRKLPLAVKKKIALPERKSTVYDLETGCHHFHVGPGALVVHNTDSLYLVAPSHYFVACDVGYATGSLSREEWFEAMVRITMRALNAIRDEVNAFLKADNGSPYLKMAYEEVLYPVEFTGKKRYFGIPHLNEVNFRPKKLFIRGIDVVKQGQSGLTRDIGNRIMWAAMALDNTRNLGTIVRDVLRDAVTNAGQWKFDDFVKTDAWKPNKNNPPVQRFIARMRPRRAAELAEARARAAAGEPARPPLYELPDPGERFSYVLVRTGATHDLYGLKSSAKKGDKMEFARAAKALGLEVDVAFYMVSYVVGLCARFVNGAAEFQPPPETAARLSEKKVDEFAQKAAKKALEAFIKGLGGLDNKTLLRRGYAYRRAFARASGAVVGALAERVGRDAAEVLHGDWLSFDLFESAEGGGGDGSDTEGEAGAAVRDPTSVAVEAVWGSAGKFAEALVAGDSEAWCKDVALAAGIGKGGRDVADAKGAPAGRGPERAPAKKLFGATATPFRKRPAMTIAGTIAGCLDRAESATRTAIAGLMPAVSEIAARYEADLTRLVEVHRLAEHAANPDIGPPLALASTAAPLCAATALPSIQAADAEALSQLRRLWFESVGIQAARQRNLAYAAYLQRLKNKRLGVVAAPPKTSRAEAVKGAAQRFRPSGNVAVAL